MAPSMLFIVNIPRRIVLNADTDTVRELHQTITKEDKKNEAAAAANAVNAVNQSNSNGGTNFNSLSKNVSLNSISKRSSIPVKHEDGATKLQSLWKVAEAGGSSDVTPNTNTNPVVAVSDIEKKISLPKKDPSSDNSMTFESPASTQQDLYKQPMDDSSLVVGDDYSNGGGKSVQTSSESVDTRSKMTQPPTVEESDPSMDVADRLDQLLVGRNITATWIAGARGKTFVVQFPVAIARMEDIMEALMGIGIGIDYGGINVLPLEISKGPVTEEFLDPKTAFKESMRSRMAMEKAIRIAKSGAELTFDYLLFVICAAIIAGVGLATNSQVSVVASMLVSPIMGPILEFTFGTVISDWGMVKHGFMVEGLSLFICLMIGFLIGVTCSYFGYHTWEWPTPEMSSRGTWQNCLVGIAIACPSGAGVALSVLGSNVPALVGVAISASLLPPAVNCGLNWAYALVGPFISGKPQRVDPFYHLTLGAWSFFLTLVNIACVYLVSLLMFKIKEVVPIPGNSRFWKSELQMTRQDNKTVKGVEAIKLAADLQDILHNESSYTHPDDQFEQPPQPLFAGRLPQLFHPTRRQTYHVHDAYKPLWGSRAAPAYR
eukprot:Ihof_evm12s174 gene=Ihof_evmTU12s174